MLHKVKWSGENIAQFWNNHNILIERGEEYPAYFSKKTGPYLVNFLKKHLQLNNKSILDYGCGPGFITQYLCENLVNSNISACDLSQVACEETFSRCKEYKNFKGVTQIGEMEAFFEKKFDVIFFFEVIEHLSDEDLSITFENFKKLLKPNGLFVLTTPNEEDLLKGTMVCPECGCYYHYVQHLRSWSESSLTDCVNRFGLKKYKAYQTTLFSPEFIKPIFSSLYGFVVKMLKGKQKNLIFIGINK